MRQNQKHFGRQKQSRHNVSHRHVYHWQRTYSRGIGEASRWENLCFETEIRIVQTLSIVSIIDCKVKTLYLNCVLLREMNDWLMKKTKLCVDFYNKKKQIKVYNTTTWSKNSRCSNGHGIYIIDIKIICILLLCIFCLIHNFFSKCRFDRLEFVLKKFQPLYRRIVAFRPTGWASTSKKGVRIWFFPSKNGEFWKRFFYFLFSERCCENKRTFLWQFESYCCSLQWTFFFFGTKRIRFVLQTTQNCADRRLLDSSKGWRSNSSVQRWYES